MECVVISRENVKPSSPTPQNLRTYQFSMLDMISPSGFIPVVLYFPNEAEIDVDDPNFFISQTVEQMKRSLSVILTRFYPLAGTINKDGESIDCNDEGVPFIVVRFTGQKLSDLLRKPDQKVLPYLLPCDYRRNANNNTISSVALIQVNYFDCGGTAIGVGLDHRMADALTMATFLNSWAAATRGSKQAVCPNYILQSIFPHVKGLPKLSFSLPRKVVKRGKTVMRRYAFDALAISSLKSKSGVERPTRVEVVSALLWKCFMAACLSNNISVSAVTNAVDLRRRAQPPFPSECFGNFAGQAVATSSNENENEFGALVRKLRDSIRKIDDEYIDRIRGDEGPSVYRKNIQMSMTLIPEDADSLNITSWCNIGHYSIDFGRGKPIWIDRLRFGGDSNLHFSNMVWIMDTRNGDGIEAWVLLDDKYMPVFDNVEELRALASIDPSPLDIPTTSIP